jgi:hypothetical protein
MTGLATYSITTRLKGLNEQFCLAKELRKNDYVYQNFNMTTEEFYDLVGASKYLEVQEAIDQGVNVHECCDNKRPPIEFASFGNDYRMIYLLWKSGAEATTPYLEEIIALFENGFTYDQIENELSKPNTEPSANLNFTSDSFHINEVPRKQLTFKEIGAEYRLILEFEPFNLDGDYCAPILHFEFSLDEETQKYLRKGGVEFEPDACASSILLKNSHNPVDLIFIRLTKGLFSPEKIQFRLNFDFEHESIGIKNEMLAVKEKIN